MKEILFGGSGRAGIDRLHARWADVLSAMGLDAAEVSAGVVFRTQSIYEESLAALASIEAQTWGWKGGATTCQTVDGQGFVRCVGSFEGSDFRDGDGRVVDGTPQSPLAYPATVWLPATGQGPFPTILFAHGIGGDRSQGEIFAGLAAQLGFAIAAIDAVQHGQHPAGGNADGNQAVMDFFAIDLATLSIDALRMRDNWRQSTYDKLQFLHVLLDQPDIDGDGADDIDVDHVVCLGISLGGIMGSELMAPTDKAGAGVIEVCGGRLSQIMQDSGMFGLFLQMQVAMGGETIPNGASWYLARAMRLPQLAPVVAPVSMVAQDALPVSGNVSAEVTGGAVSVRPGDAAAQRRAGELGPREHAGERGGGHADGAFSPNLAQRRGGGDYRSLRAARHRFKRDTKWLGRQRGAHGTMRRVSETISESPVLLSRLTTLGVGGPGRALYICESADAVRRALDGASAWPEPPLILGGGSNVLVSDSGHDGAILQVGDTRLAVSAPDPAGRVVVRAGAGLDFDRLVAETVRRRLAGLSCLSGIPGKVGAAPIQNIGAYGAEVSDAIEAVWALDRGSGREVRLPAADCEFGYRQSRFKGEWAGRFVVLAVEFRLSAGGAAAIRFGPLQRALAGQSAAELAAVRGAVLGLRRAKSMVWDPDDPNRRSAGSFFVNPVLDRDDVARAVARLEACGVATAEMPRYATPEGRVKLAAGWLVERCGFEKGYGRGPAGLSTRHCLALVNRGEARAADLVALAREVRLRVLERSGIGLCPEPVFVGFDRPWQALLS